MLYIILIAMLVSVAAGGEQFYSFSEQVGSNKGPSFKLEGIGRISGIRTWDSNGNYLRGLQLRFGDIWTEMAGIESGEMQEFELYEDEYIVQVSGMQTTFIYWLQFGTNKGRFFIAGRTAGRCFNMYPVYHGAELRIISGTYSNGLTGFATHWGVVFPGYGPGKM